MLSQIITDGCQTYQFGSLFYCRATFILLAYNTVNNKKMPIFAKIMPTFHPLG